ncbi:aldehyde dehydrogenase (NADP(+)) [Acetobacteraceae bacterium KSS8]|uniref:Aldehyde dehydrogenase (NADP(+)) n=1 Tax=Endosaccharibacter trunci TaxID=2812733 RepID=A0ABT1W5N9_9PROT|nr:aldehyde dehydrogenase (NADP(+)) [Acetobacteraceae bacterium KSS8]
MSAQAFRSIDPRTNRAAGPELAVHTAADVGAVAARAALAFEVYRATTPERRARFLEAIAAQLEADRAAIEEAACLESGLPAARINGELGRTTGQLRLFARTILRGDCFGVRLDRALPERVPPRPDLRLRRIAVGPVAVFGASNFPLAFSVAGGDTASALAAGCPVVVRGHPAHPRTSLLVAAAIEAAVRASGLPDGVFALISGPGTALGQALVSDPRIAAVGFTGSRAGGLALSRIAGERPVPIPVYAEMSSINPVILCPAALSARGEALADGFVASLVLGAGQFCTNPGLILAVRGPALEAFLARAGYGIAASPSSTMLTAGIHDAYAKGVEARSLVEGVQLVAAGLVGEGENQGRAALFATDAERFLAEPSLQEEVFGASALVVACADEAEMLSVLERLEGQLTATLQIDADDHGFAAQLLPVLETRCGRILCNGWPTGVEVSDAMVHGGPFPATTDGRTTSVGSAAIDRFLRPVCYQNLPASLLPAEVSDSNPYRIPRLVDGEIVPG